MTDTTDSRETSKVCRPTGVWNIAILCLALVAASGSVYLTLGLGLKACPLCFYQRTFAISAVFTTLMLFWLDGMRSPRTGVITLPLAASGLGVAIFHVYLVLSGKLECPPALFGWGDGPSQSLCLFTALTATSCGGAWSGRCDLGRRSFPSIAAGLLLGLGAAWACIASAPPLPPSPSQPYDAVKQPFDMCRPPFPGV